ncbi:MAG: cell wall hydrolase/autolysin [Clostridiales bacterium]|jgi:N-acetylmuramoyl-L-alanine amidase|nr:cell wall hydrolase/autolysin [Clostridiales bacterium]
MIVVVSKNNIILIALILILSVLLFGLNFGLVGSSPVNVSGMQRTVMLDPGHGGEDPGAVSIYSGLKEKDVNLYVAKKVKELLEAENYNVVMTRSEDKLEYQSGTTSETSMRRQDLTRRKKIMDESAADIVVSIHMNKLQESTDSKWFGAQTFYPPNSPEGQKLAESIQSALREKVDPINKRSALQKKEPIIIFNNVIKTIAIVECGFLSNPEEEKKLVTKEYQDKLAEGIKEGINKYFKDKK